MCEFFLVSSELLGHRCLYVNIIVVAKSSDLLAGIEPRSLENFREG